MVSAGVGGQVGAESAEERRDRGVVFFSDEIPEGIVERAVAHVVVGAQFTFEVVVDLLAMIGVAANEHWGEHGSLGERGWRADPVGDVFAGEAVIGVDLDGEATGGEFVSFDIGHVAHTGCGLFEADVCDFKLEFGEGDLVDDGHGVPLGNAPPGPLKGVERREWLRGKGCGLL